MHLHVVDWALILAYCIGAFAVGAYFSRRASVNIKEFFVAGGKLSWWLAGTSMVATTFAVDTPLAVSALVRQGGIYKNWFWWCAVSGGVLMVFFYARLWRRSALITDAEFIELRYDGRSAAILRGGLAAYFGICVNSIILGWVLLAMVKICGALFDLSALDAAMTNATNIELEWGKIIVIGLLALMTLTYTAMSGLWGVVVADFVQFIFAMAGSVALACIVVWKLGGISSMVEQIRETPAYDPNVFRFVPDWRTAGKLAAITFAIQFVVQGWLGGQGSGLICQRLFSAKDERHSAQAALWFYFAHIVLRSWPWIVVGLASLICFPLTDGEDAEMFYPKMVVEFMPIGLRGLMVASFLAAFMSTVSTQLNWAASYLVSDLYQRFLVKKASDRHYVIAARISTILIMALGMLAAWKSDSIVGAWIYLGVLTAGAGLVGLFRWFWWRINAWSEVAALGSSLVLANGHLWCRGLHGLGLLTSDSMESIEWFYSADMYAVRIVGLVLICTVISVAVTFLTRPVADSHLKRFYRRVRPGGWWGHVAVECPEVKPDKMCKGWPGVFTGIIAIYGGLFGIGYLCTAKPLAGLAWFAVGAIACWLTIIQIPANSSGQETEQLDKAKGAGGEITVPDLSKQNGKL